MRLVCQGDNPNKGKPHGYTLYLIEPLSENIQLVNQTDRAYSNFDIIPRVFLLGEMFAKHLREENWTYDHTRKIRRGDNSNKKTLISIPCFVYGP